METGTYQPASSMNNIVLESKSRNPNLFVFQGVAIINLLDSIVPLLTNSSKKLLIFFTSILILNPPIRGSDSVSACY